MESEKMPKVRPTMEQALSCLDKIINITDYPQDKNSLENIPDTELCDIHDATKELWLLFIDEMDFRANRYHQDMMAQQNEMMEQQEEAAQQEINKQLDMANFPTAEQQAEADVEAKMFEKGEESP